MDAEMLGWAEARNASGTHPSGGRTTPWTAVEIQPIPHRQTESSVFELTCAGFLHVAVVVAAVAASACGSCRHKAEVSAAWTPGPE